MTELWRENQDKHAIDFLIAALISFSLFITIFCYFKGGSSLSIKRFVAEVAEFPQFE